VKLLTLHASKVASRTDLICGDVHECYTPDVPSRPAVCASLHYQCSALLFSNILFSHSICVGH
jgi:hypothetical protein